MGRRSRGNTRPGFAIRVMWPFAKAVAQRQPVALPLFPLSTVLFPGGLLPLKIFEQRYIAMAKACIRDGSEFGVCLIKEGREVGTPAVPQDVGCLARIVHWDMPQFGVFHLQIEGLQRSGHILDEVAILVRAGSDGRARQTPAAATTVPRSSSRASIAPNWLTGVPN